MSRLLGCHLFEARVHKQYGNGLTCNSLKLFREEHDNAQIVLVLGSDIREVIEDWAGFDEIKGMLDREEVELWFVERHPAISSTGVRAAYAANDLKKIERWVPSDVKDYISQNGLYRRAL